MTIRHTEECQYQRICACSCACNKDEELAKAKEETKRLEKQLAYAQQALKETRGASSNPKDIEAIKVLRAIVEKTHEAVEIEFNCTCRLPAIGPCIPCELKESLEKTEHYG